MLSSSGKAPVSALGLLGVEERISEAPVASVEELFEKCLVVKVRRAIQAQPARQERRDRALVPGLDELLGE